MRLKTRRGTSHFFTNLDASHIYSIMSLVEPLASRRVSCYASQVLHRSRRVMYDDYEFDFAYDNDFGDTEEYDLDEDYARDDHDYQELAYRHYA